LVKTDYLVVLNTVADGMSEATRTLETFNAAIKEVCDTFKMEKFHEEQQKAIDLFSDGGRCLYFIACNGIGNRALLKQINSLYHRYFESCDRSARLLPHQRLTKMSILCPFTTRPFLSLHLCS